jgi:hypothetical protein
MTPFCVALSGLCDRVGLRTWGVAPGWHVDGPLGRNRRTTNHNGTPLGRNRKMAPIANRQFETRLPQAATIAIPPRTGQQHVSLGQRPRKQDQNISMP